MSQNSKQTKNFILEILIIVFGIALDQIAKYLTDLYLMPLGTSYLWWKNVLSFVSVHNRGAAFGILSGSRWLFIVLTILVCIGLIVLLICKQKNLHLLERIAFSMIFAGAVGNLIDRISLGYVRDMLCFEFIDFPVFNVADSILCIGAALLIIDVLFLDGKRYFRDKPKSMDSDLPSGQEQQHD